jgi:hypothetical protein
MECLYCGDCCLRLFPLTNGTPCSYIYEIAQRDSTFFYCGIYKNRPIECKNHTFEQRFCPIGLSKLKLKTIDEIRLRINDGWCFVGD